MGLFSKKSATATDAPVEPGSPIAAHEKGQDGVEVTKDGSDSEPEFGTEKQAGVKNMEAATKIWTKRDLIIAYVIIWLIYFITSTQEVVLRVLNPYVTSDFKKHSMSAAVTIVSGIIGGITKLPLAKILDTWGRPQGLTLMLVVWVLGFIITASAKNIETYAAANVFSSVGSQGVSYCLTIFIADTSSLLNRPLMLAYATSPYIFTTWIGGPIADTILPNWRWGFGLWAIVTPVVVLPLALLFVWNGHKAKKAGMLQETKTKLTPKTIYNYCVEVDIVGMLLLAGGWVLFLLPFSLWSYQEQQWKAPIIICFFVFGVVLLIAFLVWEKFFAPVTFIPYKLLMDRTVFFGGMMFIFVFANSSIWGSFFYSMLVVVWNTGATKAAYIGNIYRVGSCFSSIILGVLMRTSGRFKWVATLYGIPLMLLGVGLMIHFRQAYQDIGYVIMTQIFIAFAGGPIVVAGEMAMMAPSDHQNLAVIIAILDLFSSIGGGCGSAISSAIWTGTFKKELTKHLPRDAPVAEIYASLETQLSYPYHSVIRNGISEAYSASQRYMLITSVCLLAVAWGCSWMWRDIKLNTKKQTAGLVV